MDQLSSSDMPGAISSGGSVQKGLKLVPGFAQAMRAHVVNPVSAHKSASSKKPGSLKFPTLSPLNKLEESDKSKRKDFKIEGVELLSRSSSFEVQNEQGLKELEDE